MRAEDAAEGGGGGGGAARERPVVGDGADGGEAIVLIFPQEFLL